MENSENDDFVKSLCNEMRPTAEGSVHITNLIIKTLSRVFKLDSLSVSKECKLNILKRGIERNVILERNLNVQCIVTDLLENPYCDKDEVLRLQHFMYLGIMKIEADSIKKEIVSLNCVAAKERRLLKSITDDNVFKLCTVFLQGKKASQMIRSGFENEVIWKKAMLSKDEQMKSIDDWLKLVKVISMDRQCGDAVISNEFTALNSLSVSKTFVECIRPCNLVEDGFFDEEMLGTIDNDLENLNRPTSLKPPDKPFSKTTVDVDATAAILNDRNDGIELNETTGLFANHNANISDSNSMPTDLCKGFDQPDSIIVREKILRETPFTNDESRRFPNDVAPDDVKRPYDIATERKYCERDAFRNGKFNRDQRQALRDVRNTHRDVHNDFRSGRNERNRHNGFRGHLHRGHLRRNGNCDNNVNFDRNRKW